MHPLPEIFLLGFAIGLTGALAPGPTLVATIGAALRGGWRAGPRVSAGHIAVEAVIFLLILAGARTGMAQHTGVISIAGGIALVGFGLLTLNESRAAAIESRSVVFAGSPCAAGAVTSASNPYFWLWWMTIGGAFLLDAFSGGIVAVVAFMAGHWSADLGWFTFVSTAISRGGRVVSPSAYRMILTACGVFLILFGVSYLRSAIL
ncbi:MAG: LysE family transporter [Methanomicrobiaceae archaeon]|nr:LysE family transporter [Methanomicrobiaceae archaeon]